MWLTTTAGFYSIVQKPGDRAADTLTVRARVRSDLVHLLALVRPLPFFQIADDKRGDYRYRVVLSRAVVEKAVLALVTGIDYDNFKARVHDLPARRGPERAAIYARVWGDLLALEAVDAAELASPFKAPGKRARKDG